MAQFSYLVMNGGQVVDGVLDAPSTTAAAEALSGQGMLVLQIKERSPQGVLGRIKLWLGFEVEQTLGIKEQVRFCRDLGMLLDGGLPLVRSLWLVTRSLGDQSTSGIYRGIGAEVSKGKPLSVALALYPGAFSPQLVAMLEVGEATGQIPLVLKQFADRLDRERLLRNKVRSAMMYPVIVLVVTAVLTLYLSLKIVPTFAKIFRDFDLQLPLVTQGVLLLSVVLRTYFLQLAVATAAAATALKAYVKTEPGLAWLAELKREAPIFKTLFMTELMERFFANLAIMLSSGVSVLQSLQILQQSFPDDPPLAKAARQVLETISKGKPIAEGLKLTGQFDETMTETVGVGEEVGRVTETMDRIATQQREKLDCFIVDLATLMEPVLIIAVGAVVGTIVSALFLPMIELSQLRPG